MGLLQHRHAGHLLCVLILEPAGTLALMLYTLLWGAGNLGNQPKKHIGSDNLCLWKQTVGELQCLQCRHLQKMSISVFGMKLALVCVYSCLLLIMFYLLFIIFMKCTEGREGWKLTHITLIIKMVILTGGLGVFLFQTSQWIQLSDLTGGFLALPGTQALLLLQICSVSAYPNLCQSSVILNREEAARAMDNLAKNINPTTALVIGSNLIFDPKAHIQLQHKG